jgi:DNA-binding CsgD family transcriptional regulator
MTQTRLSPHRKLLGAALLTGQAWQQVEAALGLTQRELQMVQSVFDNLPEAGIARRFRISEHTVHTHLNRLFKKLAVTTRTGVVLRIMEQVLNSTLCETGRLSPTCHHHHNGDGGPHHPTVSRSVKL